MPRNSEPPADQSTANSHPSDDGLPQAISTTGRGTPHVGHKLLSPSESPPIVLVLSRDPSLRLLVARSCEPPWSTQTRESLDSGRELGLGRNVGLIVLDDELLPAQEGQWFLTQINRLATGAPIIYVASEHSPEVEKSARSHGAVYYTSKPIETHRLRQVLQTWLKHLRDRDARGSP